MTAQDEVRAMGAEIYQHPLTVYRAEGLCLPRRSATNRGNFESKTHVMRASVSRSNGISRSLGNSHLCYTSEVILLSQTRVKLNMVSLPADYPKPGKRGIYGLVCVFWQRVSMP